MLFLFLFIFAEALVAANGANLADQFDGLQLDPAYQAYLSNPRLSADGNSVIGFQYLTPQEQRHLLHECGPCEDVLFRANELYENQYQEKHDEALAIFKVVKQQESLACRKRLANLPLSALELRFDPWKRTTPQDLLRRKEQHRRMQEAAIAAKKAVAQREERMKEQAAARRAAQEPPKPTTEQVIKDFRQKQGILLTTDKRRFYLEVATLEEFEADITKAKLEGNNKLATEIEKCLKYAKRNRL